MLVFLNNKGKIVDNCGEFCDHSTINSKIDKYLGCTSDKHMYISNGFIKITNVEKTYTLEDVIKTEFNNDIQYIMYEDKIIYNLLSDNVKQITGNFTEDTQVIPYYDEILIRQSNIIYSSDSIYNKDINPKAFMLYSYIIDGGGVFIIIEKSGDKISAYKSSGQKIICDTLLKFDDNIYYLEIGSSYRKTLKWFVDFENMQGTVVDECYIEDYWIPHKGIKEFTWYGTKLFMSIDDKTSYINDDSTYDVPDDFDYERNIL